MLWQVDPTSATPLFEQLASSIRGAVSSGTLRRGDRLPAAREVAESLQINLHTVLRAYQVVRDEGLVDLRRGRGAIVVAEPDAARLAALVRELTAEAARLGLDEHRLLALVRAEAQR